jgi:hypothetical protein
VTEARPASGLLVSSLLRRVAAEGGSGAVLSRGDATAGAILLVLADRGVTRRLVERGLAPNGAYGWLPAGPTAFDDPAILADYLARRRRNDPDLWVVELDAPADLLADIG